MFGADTLSDAVWETKSELTVQSFKKIRKWNYSFLIGVVFALTGVGLISVKPFPVFMLHISSQEDLLKLFL